MALRPLTAAERERIAALVPDVETHRRLMRELPFADALDVGPAPRPARGAADALRVVAWNAERCKHLEASARLLAQTAADVVLLSEMDWGMARSGQLHTARVLAERLGWGFAFGVEFLELDRGGPGERAAHAGETDSVGYHGGAILSRHALEDARLVRLDEDASWFDGARGERRVGSRIAVTARVAGCTFASVHLESHSDPDDRARQLRRLLAAVDEYAPTGPAVVGGDLNTLSVPTMDFLDPPRIARALEEDPARWAHPVPHEPLFAAAESAGFEWRTCNVLREPTQRIADGTTSRRGTFKLDWLLCRGLRAASPEVIDAVDGRGRAISDHEAVAATVRTRRTAREPRVS